MKWIVCAIVLACMSGCGFKEQLVRVAVPDVGVNPQQGAPVQVNPVQDNRPASFLAQFPAESRDKNVGGVVRGGLRINVVLGSSTTTLKVHSIIVQALRNMGYRTVASCEPSCIVITPTLNAFAVTLPFDFWRSMSYSQHMLADVTASVAVQDHGRTTTFDVTGHGSNVYQRISKENWEIALDKATKNFIINFQQQMLLHADQGATSASEPSERGAGSRSLA